MGVVAPKLTCIRESMKQPGPQSIFNDFVQAETSLNNGPQQAVWLAWVGGPYQQLYELQSQQEQE